MGLRSIYEMTMPEGIGRDAFIRIGVMAGLVVNPTPNIPKTTIAHPSARYKNLLVNEEFTDVNQIWTSDITYYRVDDKWCYLVFIMDVYSRKILGFSASDNLRAINNVKALQMAIKSRNVTHFLQKLIHHSDRGGQYISDEYIDLLTSSGIRISMCTNVLENAHIERVNGTIKNYYLKYWKNNNLEELNRNLKRAVNAYNNKPHQSLNNLSPNEFEKVLIQIPVEDRDVLKIFCYQQNVCEKDPNQLVFEF